MGFKEKIVPSPTVHRNNNYYFTYVCSATIRGRFLSDYRTILFFHVYPGREGKLTICISPCSRDWCAN